MSRLSNRSEKDVKAILVDALSDIMDDGETPLREKIKSIELLGREYGMFVERKQVNVDVRTIVSQLTDQQLKVISGEVGDRGDYIDVLPGGDLGGGKDLIGAGAGEQGSDSGDPGSGPQDESELDQGESGEDRKEAR